MGYVAFPLSYIQLTYKALNDNIFPLNTETYPVTKNIKAELAGIIIIAVLGVVSQLRVWKLVKEHRDKSDAQQLEKQQDQDREEEALGRQIEDNFQRERAQWEAAYGDKNAQESSVASSIMSPKYSTSIREKEVLATDSFELVDMATPTHLNPIGAKGIGEAGTIGATPAVQSAVVDAVYHLGVRHIDMPCTPERVWRAIQEATA